MTRGIVCFDVTLAADNAQGGRDPFAADRTRPPSLAGRGLSGG